MLEESGKLAVVKMLEDFCDLALVWVRRVLTALGRVDNAAISDGLAGLDLPGESGRRPSRSGGSAC